MYRRHFISIQYSGIALLQVTVQNKHVSKGHPPTFGYFCVVYNLGFPAWCAVFMSQIFLGPSRSQTREYIDWQWQLSGVHSITMVFSAQPGEPPLLLYYPSTRVPSHIHPSPAKLAREGYLVLEY
jgi:hypothetical protein